MVSRVPPAISRGNGGYTVINGGNGEAAAVVVTSILGEDDDKTREDKALAEDEEVQCLVADMLRATDDLVDEEEDKPACSGVPTSLRLSADKEGEATFVADGFRTTFVTLPFISHLLTVWECAAHEDEESVHISLCSYRSTSVEDDDGPCVAERFVEGGYGPHVGGQFVCDDAAMVNDSLATSNMVAIEVRGPKPHGGYAHMSGTVGQIVAGDGYLDDDGVVDTDRNCRGKEIVEDGARYTGRPGKTTKFYLAVPDRGRNNTTRGSCKESWRPHGRLPGAGGAALRPSTRGFLHCRNRRSRLSPYGGGHRSPTPRVQEGWSCRGRPPEHGGSTIHRGQNNVVVGVAEDVRPNSCWTDVDVVDYIYLARI